MEPEQSDQKKSERMKNLSPPPNWRSKLNSPAQTSQAPENTVQASCNSVELVAVESIPAIVTASTLQTASDKQSVNIMSDKPLSECRFSTTIFERSYITTPKKERRNVTWNEINDVTCPQKPDFLSDKHDGKYFIPCLLREAPLVGKTLELAKLKGSSTIGMMRSASHVTEATFGVFDVDGVSEQGYLAALENIKTDGISYIAFTTYSHGSPDKPGMRCRILIAFDRPVTPEEYTAAWRGVDQKYFCGQLFKSDPSGAKLHQQQGVWSCHTSRIRHAQSWRHDSGVASVDFFIQLGRTVIPTATASNIRINHVDDDAPNAIYPVRVLIDLVKCLDPDLSYPEWFLVLAAIFNITNGSSEGLDIADAWSSGGKRYKGFNDVRKYWNTVRPDHPRPVKMGTLVMLAQKAGADVTAIMQGESFEICESVESDSDEVDLAAPTETPYLKPLAALQQQFGLLSISGKLCVFDRSDLAIRSEQHTARKLLLSNRSDGALLIERALRAAYPDVEEPKEIVKLFFVHPDTACYCGIEFNPKGTSANHLNLWEGPTIIPQEGSWLEIQEFLFEIICDKDWDSYIYLLFFIAHALQKPEEKPGVMIILLGGQGIGKGTVGRIFRKIWSATYIQINNVEEIVGTFNAILERSYIIFMDEALFAGNRRGTDELKSIVTEPIIQISEKYQPSRQIRSVHRFIAATNADHFKNTERDDRRDFTLRVSEARKGDLDYWNELNEEIEYGGVEAMVHDLLAINLSDFNVRQKPNTKELVEQKIHSLDPIQRWWHDGLYNGAFTDSDKWPEFISTSDAINGINEVNGGRMHKKPSALIISQALHKLCPSAKQHQQQSQFSRHRGYLLPPLQQARTEFEKYIGGVVEWPEVESAAESSAHASLGDSLGLRALVF